MKVTVSLPPLRAYPLLQAELGIRIDGRGKSPRQAFQTYLLSASLASEARSDGECHGTSRNARARLWL
jgi:hypothetical protein